MVRPFATGGSVIQSILVYTLGFLTAALLALVAAPSLWRRAVRLTRERVVASVPLSMNEIEAEKDRMRAAFAMEIRQIEMKLAASRERVAGLMMDVSEARARTTGGDEALEQEKRRAGALAKELASASEQADKLKAALRMANEAIERFERDARRMADENEELAGLHQQAALRAGSLEVELAGREGDLARLREEIRETRETGRKIAGRGKTASSELKAAEAALRVAQRRLGEMEKKHDKAVQRLAGRDADTERLNAEVARLRAATKKSSAPAGNVLNLDAARLSAENAALREQVLDLAAKVVAATAAAEGAASPINALLEKAAAMADAPSGLAERIRAFQKSASSGRN